MGADLYTVCVRYEYLDGARLINWESIFRELKKEKEGEVVRDRRREDVPDMEHSALFYVTCIYTILI